MFDAGIMSTKRNSAHHSVPEFLSVVSSILADVFAFNSTRVVGQATFVIMATTNINNGLRGGLKLA